MKAAAESEKSVGREDQSYARENKDNRTKMLVLLSLVKTNISQTVTLAKGCVVYFCVQAEEFTYLENVANTTGQRH